MKVTREQLKNLIKEEASRIRQQMEIEKNKSSRKAELENRKAEIMLEMTGMYGEDTKEMEEGIFGPSETPEQQRERFKQKIQSSGLMRVISSFEQQYKMVPGTGLEQVLNIVVKNKGVLPKTIKYDPASKQILDASKWGVSAGAQSLAEKTDK